jgi:hypothetical protein
VEARNPFGVVGVRIGKDFDRDATIQLRVLREIHLAHAPGTEQAENFMGAETKADGQRHAPPQ